MLTVIFVGTVLSPRIDGAAIAAHIDPERKRFDPRSVWPHFDYLFLAIGAWPVKERAVMRGEILAEALDALFDFWLRQVQVYSHLYSVFIINRLTS